MRTFLTLVFTLAFSFTGMCAKNGTAASNVSLLFVAKVILSAIIVFVGISALRTFLRHEKSDV